MEGCSEGSLGGKNYKRNSLNLEGKKKVAMDGWMDGCSEGDLEGTVEQRVLSLPELVRA